MCRREGNDLPEMLVGGCNPALRDADERAQYVWAHDGNVQSCHRRLMISVDRKNVCGFFPVSSTTACALTPLSTYSSWFFLDALVFSSGRTLTI